MRNIPSNSVDALLFDLGGVVIEIDFDRAFSRWALYSNRNIEFIKSGFAFDSYYERHERGEIEASEYFTSLRRSLGINITDEEFIVGWNSIFVGAIPGIAALLSEARENLSIYAFTNSNLTHQHVWTKKFRHLLNLFRDVFVSSEIGNRKPEPAAFKIISREIDVKLENILLFDDTLENIAGAKKIGMQAVHVTSPMDIEIGLKEILA